ncbi:hypothetical protein GA0111570_112111 [Raineyella antarctica]|uniref:Uncharacterized protein n=1 Tax=Raineyella antarctica TaxID=1577474 RepID=A0A1G6HUD8_9ACTN|nr:hypothetical protein [Raineyella antarctica]SDB97758.1 hypothetical protein GA0111570_112111 [Raineyella antarctica]
MNESVEDIRDKVAEQARSILPQAPNGAGAQVAPLTEQQLRVTYKDGSFRILDIGGFLKVGNLSDKAIHDWTYAMLVSTGPLPSHVPVNDLAPSIVGTDLPGWVLSRPVGEGLLEVIVHGEGYVSEADLSAWEVDADRVFSAVRSRFALTPFEPILHEGGVVEIASEDWTASAWAFYPSVLKAALGIFDAPAVVWLPDSGHLVVAPASNPAVVEAARTLVDELYQGSPRPLSRESYVAHSRHLERF